MRVKALIAGFVGASSLLAQDAPAFPKAAYFRTHFSTPDTRVDLQPPVRFEDFRVNGGLELSLRSYLELVLANNTDIAIQRLNLEAPRNAIMRAFGTFDPTFTSSFNAQRQKSASTSVLQGATLLSSLSQRLNTGYQQTLESGTQFNVNLNGTKDSSNDAFRTFNPALNATMLLGFTQPLLRNRGASMARTPPCYSASPSRCCATAGRP